MCPSIALIRARFFEALGKSNMQSMVNTLNRYLCDQLNGGLGPLYLCLPYPHPCTAFDNVSTALPWGICAGIIAMIGIFHMIQWLYAGTGRSISSMMMTIDFAPSSIFAKCNSGDRSSHPPYTLPVWNPHFQRPAFSQPIRSCFGSFNLIVYLSNCYFSMNKL